MQISFNFIHDSIKGWKKEKKMLGQNHLEQFDIHHHANGEEKTLPRLFFQR